MTPLRGPLASGAVVTAWRLDGALHARHWDSGIGAERYGGRWNPKGLRVVYASFDPATTLLEAAVHRGFRVLDTQPFVLTGFAIHEPSDVKIVWPGDVPNPAWLHPGIPSAGQQEWATTLLDGNAFVALPSVVSRLSWNVIFRPDKVPGRYALSTQVRVAIDTRLNPRH